MSLRAKIEFKNRSGRLVSTALRYNQTLIVGASNAADVQLADESDVHAKHCEVKLTPNGCQLKDLTRGKGVISIDGKPVVETELTSDATVKIGVNDVKLIFEVDERAVAPARSPVPTAVAPSATTRGGASRTVTSLTPAHDQVPSKQNASRADDIVPPAVQFQDNGLRIFEISQHKQVVSWLGENIAGSRKFFQVVNYRLCGETPEEHELTDLLVEFPGEVRKDNSLTILGPAAWDESVSACEKYMKQNACLLLSPGKPETGLKEFLKESKLLYAWWLNPSTFDFNMREGIEMLVGNVFDLIELAIYFLPDKETWVVLTRDPAVNSFDDLSKKPATSQAANN